MRITVRTSRTRSLGRMSFKLPPSRARETYVPAMVAIPELSIMVRPARFTRILRTPSAANFRRSWSRRSVLGPIDARPFKSTMVTPSDSRVEISRGIATSASIPRYARQMKLRARHGGRAFGGSRRAGPPRRAGVHLATSCVGRASNRKWINTNSGARDVRTGQRIIES